MSEQQGKDPYAQLTTLVSDASAADANFLPLSRSKKNEQLAISMWVSSLQVYSLTGGEDSRPHKFWSSFPREFFEEFHHS